MTYNEEIKKAASLKKYLVRIEGVRSLMNGELIGTFSGYDLYRTYIKDVHIKNILAYSGNNTPISFARVYTKTFPINPLVPSTGADTYYFDPKTGELLYYCLSLLDVTVAEFYLFFSEGEYLRAPMNINDGEDVLWHPRILGKPSFGFSQENITSGLLSISSSDIEFKNQDMFFNKYLSPDFGYNNRSVKVWEYINKIENNKVSFVGTIKLIDNNNSTCSISFNDILDLLDVDIYGETEVPRTLNTLGYTMQDNRKELPLTYLYGKLSPYKMVRKNIGLVTSLNVVDKSGLLEAQCVDYDTTKSHTTNRTWTCLMGPSNANTIAFNVNNATGIQFIGDMELQIIALDLPVGKQINDYFSIGDTVQIGTHYAQIQTLMNQSFTIFPRNNLITSGVNCTRLKVPVIIIPDAGVDQYLRAGRDYDCQIGVSGDLQIKFKDSFESTLPMGILDPDTHQVFFRAWYDDFDDRASEQLKRILDMASIPYAASFFPSDPYSANFNPEICFTIPRIGNQSYPSAKSMIQDILVSSFIFLYFDFDGNIRSKSFLSFLEDPNSVDNVSGFNPYDSIDKYNSNNYQSSYDFYDTYKSVKSSNQNHQSFSDGYEIQTNKTKGYSVMNSTNRVWDHINILSSRDDSEVFTFYSYIQNLVCTRRVYHSLRGHSSHFSMYIGDDVLIDRPFIIGELNSALMRLISIVKSQNEADFKFIDLKNIPL